MFLVCLKKNKYKLFNQYPDGHALQMHVTGFLDATKGRTFTRELWYLLRSAMANGGIPKEIVEMRMAEFEEAQVYFELTRNAVRR